MARGRPPTYGAAMRERVLGLVAEGVPLRTICAGRGMPDRETVMRWRRADPRFAQKMTQANDAAQLDAAEALFETIEELTAANDHARAALVFAGRSIVD